MEAAENLVKFKEVKKKIERLELPIAEVEEYSGSDIPIALPGLKLRF
jgi:hypothetical protein